MSVKKPTMLHFASVSPADILADVNPDSLPADAPPAAANYREADLDGVACAFCTKFSYQTSEQDEDGNLIPVGVCTLWEAKVRGDFVSSGYAESGPTYNKDGEEVWDFSDDSHVMGEIHCAIDGQATEDGKLVKKRVLRTGVWDTTPTSAGKVKKRLQIVKDGKSDARKGIISLAELKENFQRQAIQNVMIPLSDIPGDDHLVTQNMTKLNTGFVRSVDIEEEDGTAYLVASMEFTEPEVKEKVLNGTYADVSAGIPFKVTSRGKDYGAALHHVCITNTPFIDGLGPFMAASDDSPSNVNVVHFNLTESSTEEITDDGQELQLDVIDGAAEAADEDEDQPEEVQEEALSLTETLAAAQVALVSQHGLSDNYVAHDVRGDKIVVRNKIADKTWNISYTVEGREVKLAEFSEWEMLQDGEEDAPAPEPAIAASSDSPSSDHELAAAQAMRCLRAPQTNNTNKEAPMPAMTREELEALNFSDEQMAAYQSALDENATLRAATRTAEADRRVDELKELGFSNNPGFLKLYRDVKLSDDGGPAVVLLSDNGSKERLTALEILDKAIDALTIDGKVQFADQHINPGHDDPPPPASDSEERPLADRVADAKAALGRA